VGSAIYRRIHASFWTGTTGKQIRPTDEFAVDDYLADLECRIVATYLMTSPHSTMCGIYHLPIGYASIDTGLSQPAVHRALDRLERVGFCVYDRAIEVVWVCEMARYQVDGRLQANDKRRLSIQMALQSIEGSPIVDGFIERYRESFDLDLQAFSDAPPGGASKGGVPPHKSQKQNSKRIRNQKILGNQTVQETRDLSKESERGTRKRAPRSTRERRRPVDLPLSPEGLAFAMKCGLTESQALTEWAAMGDHEYATPKSDWEAAWRQWVRRAADWRPSAPVSARPAGRFAAEVSQGVADRLRAGASFGDPLGVPCANQPGPEGPEEAPVP